MKRAIPFILASLLVVTFTQYSSAQVRKLPAVVTDAFKDKYPDASKVEWRDKLSVFTATFQEGDVQYQANFTNKGDWKSTSNEIGENDLPDVVKDGVSKSKYAEWEMGSLHKIVLPGDVTQYKVEVIKTDIQKKNLLFNSEGRLLKDNYTL